MKTINRVGWAISSVACVALGSLLNPIHHTLAQPEEPEGNAVYGNAYGNANSSNPTVGNSASEKTPQPAHNGPVCAVPDSDGAPPPPGAPMGIAPSGRMSAPTGPPPGGPVPDGHAHGPLLGDFLRKLNLTAEQNEKIGQVMGAEREKMDAIHEQVKKLHAESRTKLKGILTEAQHKQLEELEATLTAPPTVPARP